MIKAVFIDFMIIWVPLRTQPGAASAGPASSPCAYASDTKMVKNILEHRVFIVSMAGAAHKEDIYGY